MRLFAIALAVFLAGCQALNPRDESLPSYVPPAGSTLTLNRELTIPADKTSVYIQDGRVLAWGLGSWSGIDQYKPHCKFEVWHRRDQPRVVKPDTFTITKSVQEEQIGSGSPRTQVAAAGIGFFLGTNGEDGGAPILIFATQMLLKSERQPEVYRMTCQQWDYLSEGEHVSINDMRRALGDIATLRLPAQGAEPQRAR